MFVIVTSVWTYISVDMVDVVTGRFADKPFR